MDRRRLRRSPRSLVAALAALLLATSAGSLAADAPVPWPTAGWDVSTPEAQGVPSTALADLVDFGAQRGQLTLEREGVVQRVLVS